MELVFHPVCLEHDTGFHPEKADRIKWMLEEEYVKPENGEKYVGLAHAKNYIRKVKKFSQKSVSLDLDTPLSPHSYKAGCYAVGGAVKASEINGFAVVRPPGHHAPFGGFCVFNNMAVAAIRLAEKGNRVLIVDWDVHHGNGTQFLVKDHEKIHYFSVHQSPFYPGTGRTSKGNATNIPVSAGTEDEEYIRKVNETLPALLEEFRPQVIGVSAGFDCLKGCSLAHLKLTERSYLRICELIKDYDCFFVLEGGYRPGMMRKGIKRIVSLFP